MWRRRPGRVGGLTTGARGFGASKYQILWIGPARGHTIPGREINVFKPLRRQLQALWAVLFRLSIIAVRMEGCAAGRQEVVCAPAVRSPAASGRGIHVFNGLRRRLRADGIALATPGTVVRGKGFAILRRQLLPVRPVRVAAISGRGFNVFKPLRRHLQANREFRAALTAAGRRKRLAVPGRQILWIGPARGHAIPGRGINVFKSLRRRLQVNASGRQARARRDLADRNGELQEACDQRSPPDLLPTHRTSRGRRRVADGGAGLNGFVRTRHGVPFTGARIKQM